MGGVVAFEMAQQLRAQDQEVTLLALLDTPRQVPGNPLKRGRRGIARSIYLGRRFVRHVRNLLQLGTFEHHKYVLEKGKLLKKMLTPDPPVRQANQRASRRYLPKAYPGRLCLFLASEEPVIYSPDPRLGWGEVATNGVEVYQVPATQSFMLREPHVTVLADWLRNCLDEELNLKVSGEMKAT